MIAVLLAAGLGTRLRPLTDKLPKCLVPIGGKVLLDYWFDHLSDAGIERFIVNTHYMAGTVEKHVRNSPWRDSVLLLHEEELLLTGGTLLACKPYLQDEAFMVIHADNLSFCDFSAFIEAHRTRPAGCEMTMMTFATDTPQSCGIVQLDERGVVSAFFEKVPNPPGNLANAAVYILEPSVIAFIETLHKERVDFSTEVLPAFVGKIFTFHNDRYHRDIGTLESYALAQIEVSNYKD
ncbi:MAG: nucleotidyltransferase family protein [Sulfuricurvum sp.]|nr:nucleotidyltransferase family protein [Sulfuricurvum sp.]